MPQTDQVTGLPVEWWTVRP